MLMRKCARTNTNQQTMDVAPMVLSCKQAWWCMHQGMSPCSSMACHQQAWQLSNPQYSHATAAQRMLRPQGHKPSNCTSTQSCSLFRLLSERCSTVVSFLQPLCQKDAVHIHNACMHTSHEKSPSQLLNMLCVYGATSNSRLRWCR